MMKVSEAFPNVADETVITLVMDFNKRLKEVVGPDARYHMVVCMFSEIGVTSVATCEPRFAARVLISCASDMIDGKNRRAGEVKPQ